MSHFLVIRTLLRQGRGKTISCSWHSLIHTCFTQSCLLQPWIYFTTIQPTSSTTSKLYVYADLMTLFDGNAGKVVADESGAAGDENAQSGSLSQRRRSESVLGKSDFRSYRMWELRLP